MTESSHPKLYLNLPIRDLERSVTFFEKLGFHFDPRFTDDKAACMVVGGDTFVMLLTRPFFETFTERPVSNPEQTVGGLYALSFSSRAEVDALANRVVEAGGTLLPTKDMGFMVQRAFIDLDGHQWEPFYMDMAAFESAGAPS